MKLGLDMQIQIHPFAIPECQHAQCIVNKAALSVMALPDCCYNDGRFAVTSPYSRSAIAYLLQMKTRILQGSEDYSRLSSAYVFSSSTGRVEYIYVVVRCGKCPLCRFNKQNDLIFRCQMESACYHSPCYMITLTYDNSCLPCNRINYVRSNTLYYKDIQDFFKRLRIKWTRQGLPHNIRYLVAGEYGSERQRPHYHILLWNNPYDANPLGTPMQILGHKRLSDDIFSAWHMCERQAFQCDPCGDGAAAYCAKYVSKMALYNIQYDCRATGRALPFIRTSIKNGGIGAPCIQMYKDFYKQNPESQEFTFRSYNGNVTSVKFSSFLTGKLYPSLSRQVSSRYKLLYTNLKDVLTHMYQCGLVNQRQYIAKMRQYSLNVLTFQVPELSRDFITMQPVIDYYPETDDTYIIDIAERLQAVYSRVVAALDDAAPCERLRLDEYSRHRLAVIPTPDMRQHLDFKIHRLRSKIANQQAKEVL